MGQPKKGHAREEGARLLDRQRIARQIGGATLLEQFFLSSDVAAIKSNLLCTSPMGDFWA